MTQSGNFWINTDLSAIVSVENMRMHTDR